VHHSITTCRQRATPHRVRQWTVLTGRWSHHSVNVVSRLCLKVFKALIHLAPEYMHYRAIGPYSSTSLTTYCKAQDGVRPSPDRRRARGRPFTTWIHQIRRDTGIPVSDALELAGDRSFSTFWRQIATAGRYGWSLRATMMMTMFS